ncbi:MAG: oligoendopeptidase F [Myxococcales bacterium]|nr:oligoendopeptidase F [Myxococcales bacterium]
MSELRERKDVPREDQWNLDPLYASLEAWEADFQKASKFPSEVAQWKGQLATDEQTLSQALRAMFDSYRAVEKLYVFAHLRNDEDLSNSQMQDIYERARALYHQLSTAVAYVAPELLGMNTEQLQSWIEHPDLAPYKVYLGDLLRRKPHTLSQAEERLLAMADEPLSATEKVFSMLNNIEIPERLPKVPNEEGKEAKLTHGTYYQLLQSTDQEVRRKAFSAYYETFKGSRNTMAAALDGKVKAGVFKAKARNHSSARAAALFPDNVPTEVYDNLIQVIHDRFDDFYRYMELRKRVMGLDKMHLYDTSVSLVADFDVKYEWRQAEELVLDSLKPLGDDYLKRAHEGFKQGWFDRYENKGKRSGAYSSGCYDSPPYILHNFNGTLHSVFTLAHELGHSMHTLLSNTTQPYQTAEYKIFVAEVASTTNEALLMHAMLQQNKDPKFRAYLLNQYLNDFRSTMFRQTMFGEFERDIYAAVEKGEAALTADSLDQRYYALVKQYFGNSVAWEAEDEMIAWEWSRIPHFYYNFYVYKYATGMAAATALSQQIINEGAPAVERYLNFLQSGGSKHPLDLLKGAGVDLTTPAPIESALDTFRTLLDELEGLLG